MTTTQISEEKNMREQYWPLAVASCRAICPSLCLPESGLCSVAAFLERTEKFRMKCTKSRVFLVLELWEDHTTRYGQRNASPWLQEGAHKANLRNTICITLNTCLKILEPWRPKRSWEKLHTAGAQGAFKYILTENIKTYFDVLAYFHNRYKS